MAVTLDTKSATNLFTDAMEGTTQVWSHTTNAGSNTLLLVFVSLWNLSGSLSSVTFGSDTLTEYTGGGTNGAGALARIFYKINPTVQTANITVTWSVSGGGISYASASFFGAHQTTPLYNPQAYAAPSGNTPLSVVVTTAAGDMAIDLCEGTDDNPTVNDGGTLIVETSSQGAGESCCGHYLAASGASTTLTWAKSSGTGGMNPDALSFGVAIQQAAGGGGTPSGLPIHPLGMSQAVARAATR